MEISEPDVWSEATVAQMYAIHRQAAAEDRPELPGPCSYAFPIDLRRPHPGARISRRVATVDSKVVGQLDLWFPTLDNLHLAGLNVVVAPSARRRGIGRALLELGIESARADGRRTVTATALASVPGGRERSVAGSRLLQELDFQAALTEVCRITDITALDPATEFRLYQDALRSAADYSLQAWTGPVPEDLLDDVAALNSSFVTEAPTGELDLEPENVDAQRVRDTDEAIAARGMSVWGVVARHRDSGQAAAITMIGKTREPPDHAGQWITLVHPQHRGHRLGLLTKLENHRQVRRDAPAVRWVSTSNADVNEHMIAINEQLGYQVLDGNTEFQRRL